jgi:hypothetical protein
VIKKKNLAIDGNRKSRKIPFPPSLSQTLLQKLIQDGLQGFPPLTAGQEEKEHKETRLDLELKEAFSSAGLRPDKKTGNKKTQQEVDVLLQNALAGLGMAVPLKKA